MRGGSSKLGPPPERIIFRTHWGWDLRINVVHPGVGGSQIGNRLLRASRLPLLSARVADGGC
jgi:hypothetical protein